MEEYTNVVDVDAYVVTKDTPQPKQKQKQQWWTNQETYSTRDEPGVREIEQYPTRTKEDADEESVNFRKQRMLAGLWLVALVLIYAVLTTSFVLKMTRERNAESERQAVKIDPDKQEKGKTQSSVAGSSSNETTADLVEVGFYLDRVTEFSIMESAWTADFYLWFRWTDRFSGEEPLEDANTSNTNTRRSLKLIKPKPSATANGGIPDGSLAYAGAPLDQEEPLDPGETFQVIDGELVSKEELERKTSPIILPDNTTQTQLYLHYTLYRVQAKWTKFFEVVRFPRDNHMLTLQIEDSKRDHNRLLYVADTEGSKISSRAEIIGYEIGTLSTISKLHAYKSARGDPWADPAVQINYSQFLGGIPIYRPNWGLYWMMFQGVFAAVGVAFIGLSIKNESRYDLGIGGFFAVVAATYVSSTQLPMAGVFSLADCINGISLFTVLLTLLHIFIECHIFKDNVEGWFKHLGLFLFVAGYLACIWQMSKAASIN